MFILKNRVLLLFTLLLIALQGCSSSVPETPLPESSSTVAVSDLLHTSSTVEATHSPAPTDLSVPTNPPTNTISPTSSVLTETVVPTNLAPSPSPKLSPSGWLAIGSYGTFPDAIDLIHASGKGWRNIMGNHESSPHDPFWSPDGQWIAFNKFRDDELGSDIYIMRPDGSDQQQLTNTPTYKRAYSWSPDGRTIVFSRTDGGPDEAEVDIFIVDVETLIVKQLTDTPGVYEHNPIYSPKGDIIAFTSVQDDDSQNHWYLMFMNPNGSNPRRVMETPVGGSKLAWSPTGDQIVLSSADECKDLYIVSSDGTGFQQLTDASGSEINPAWSLDGNWIAFMGTEVCASGGATGWEIFLVRPDGTDLVQITNNPQRHPISPAWSPLPDLRVDETYVITESGTPINLRSEPTLSGNVLEKLKEGVEILILEGPKEADEFLWWRVRMSNSDLEGWVAETPGWFVNH